MDKKSKDHNLVFDKAYRELNTAQRKAVDAIEGPILVIAGPGTGKTQILATRIGKILKQTDSKPSNILCLTYTDTGKAEMRNRLFTLIGPDAYRVSIHTFHSFCNEVIRDNRSYFGRQNLDLLSDLEEAMLYQKLLDELPPDNPLKSFREENTMTATQVKNLFALMKKQAWEPDYMIKCINDYITKLPEKEEFIYKRKFRQFAAGEPKQDKIKDETEKMERLRAAINLYPVYLDTMSTMARYTYDDMILSVLKAFSKNNDILLNYQEQYHYFLVDEFQDTSRSQNLLLNYLTNFWEDKPNVFAVGDDDQSIYSFQDANVENMTDFRNRYKENLETVVLTENYRSTQVILDYSKQLIEYNKQRLPNIDKILTASNPKRKNISNPPEIVEYQNPASEVINVAGAIEELIGTGVQPKEIAVIYRQHKQIENIEEYLLKKKIGVNIKRNVDILELPFIKKIITLLNYIANENDNPHSGEDKLFELLHFDFFKLSPLEIARITLEVSKKASKGKFNLREYINQQVEKSSEADLFKPAEINEIKRISNLLEYLIGKVQNETLQGLFEEVINEAGILNYILQSSEKNWLMEVLRSFFNFIKQEVRKKPELNLRGLLDLFSTMNKFRLRLPLQRISAAENGVNLMTAHGCKGAEFEYVFLIGCNKNQWGAKSSSRGNKFKLPDNLMGHEVKTDEIEESRRLFYVAMTRAKSHLQISYLLNDDDGKPLEPSEFIGELIESAGAEPVYKKTDEKLLLGFIEIQFHRTAPPQIELVDKVYVEGLLKNYSLSVTHLNNFLSCPIKFYYQNLIKVPSAVGDNMAFGNVIHATLQRLFEKMKANNGIFPSKEEMLGDFDWNMNRYKASFTTTQYKKRSEHGREILPPYYDWYINKWNKTVRIEQPIRNVEVNGVPINGKLDKLEFTGKNVNVVDYKTGSYEKAKKKLKPPGEKEPIGGDYWRQAVFYKILLDNYQLYQWQTESVEFDFVEPVKQKYVTSKVMVTPEDIRIVKEQITDTWNKIHNHEFHTGCGKKDCQWCNFVKDNNLSIPLQLFTDKE